MVTEWSISTPHNLDNTTQECVARAAHANRAQQHGTSEAVWILAPLSATYLVSLAVMWRCARASTDLQRCVCSWKALSFMDFERAVWHRQAEAVVLLQARQPRGLLRHMNSCYAREGSMMCKGHAYTNLGFHG